jgi:hypothetical protein
MKLERVSPLTVGQGRETPTNAGMRLMDTEYKP